eukprot:SAG31_NODE_8923_length_1362_cov_26.665875_3_plen_136_part_01
MYVRQVADGGAGARAAIAAEQQRAEWEAAVRSRVRLWASAAAAEAVEAAAEQSANDEMADWLNSMGDTDDWAAEEKDEDTEGSVEGLDGFKATEAVADAATPPCGAAAAVPAGAVLLDDWTLVPPGATEPSLTDQP